MKLLLCSILAIALSAGCASCDEDTNQFGPNNANNNGIDAGNNPSNSGTNSGTNNPTNSATNNTTNGYSDSCGTYQSRCEGTCIPTSTDPDNCGGCGVICSASEVCSGGRCVGECLPGTQACERECVNTRLDNRHCDACNRACPNGEGCVDGDCVPGLDLDFDAASCEGGGPPIDLGGTQNAQDSCTGNLAELTFRWGICSCENFDVNNDLLVDAFDSGLGPYRPGGLGGGVGVNGRFSANNDVSISGTFWVAGQQGINLNGASDVGLQLRSGGDVSTNNQTTVGRDAWVRGDIDNGDAFSIAGILHALPGSVIGNTVTYASLQREVFDVAPPCTGGCAPDEPIGVASIVSRFSQNNDNGVIGLDEDVLNRANPSNTPIRIDLPCGRYYLSGINTNAPVTIVAHGNTALFIGGDVRANNPLTLTLMPSAQFDVFVSGDFTTNNQIQLGSQNYPALMRLYVGGPNGFTTNNPVTLGGFIYAVPGGVNTNNETEIYGGIFAQQVDVNNDWRIHFDRRVTTVGEGCDPDPDPDNPNPDPDPDLCRREGDTCMDGQCCTPLMCMDGTCRLLDCVPAFGACDSTDDCCTGVCSGQGGICIIQ